MKFFATLMLILAFGLSVVYSQDISDDHASLDVQQFVDRVLKGQVDDEDDEIVDMDDALNKLRMLRKVYRIVAEVEADGLLHPKKRFIDFQKQLLELAYLEKLAGSFKTLTSDKDAFNKAAFAAKEHLDFDTVVAKAVSYIHSGMSVAACKKAIAAAATAILGHAASHVGSLSGPICDGALAKLEQAAG